MAISLRAYQNDAKDAVRKDWAEGYRRTIVAMPTGTGKTWLFVFLIYAAQKNGFRCLVLVNTDELVEQTVDKLGRVGLVAGVVKAERNEWVRGVVVASVQTLSRQSRLNAIPKDWFEFVIVDECHFANSLSYQRVLDKLANKFCLGVTATPFRGDKQSLAEAGWENVSYVYTLDDAVRDGWLVPIDVKRVDTGISLDNVRSSVNGTNGVRDFVSRSLSGQVNTKERNEKIVEAYFRHMHGLRSIGFCVTVEHAWALANAFRKRGIDAKFVHGGTPEKERRRMLAAHRAGDFKVLTNCNVLTHGYDDPSLEGIIMARPTQSKVLYVQAVGRGLRPNPGKDKCLLLDVVDVSKEHSLAINSEILGLKDEMGRPVLGPAEDER